MWKRDQREPRAGWRLARVGRKGVVKSKKLIVLRKETRRLFKRISLASRNTGLKGQKDNLKRGGEHP